jgi:hypothetical protein
MRTDKGRMRTDEGRIRTDILYKTSGFGQKTAIIGLLGDFEDFACLLAIARL